jgi:predicted ATPase
MTPEQYEKAGVIFHAALDLAADRRPTFIADACRDDEDLRSEVESLLAAHRDAGAFIERPAMAVAASLIAADAATTAVPDRIGRYDVLGPIARGGMGEVYRARDAALGRELALKLPRQPYVAGSDAVRRFEQEARAASSLNHPNIVTIHEIGEADGRRFIAMELVEGQSLATMIGRPMPPAALVRIGRQLAEALAVAHAAGIAHGDIKPANIMVRSDGYVKVLDFGVARLMSAAPVDPGSAPTNGPVMMLGTPRYMSPEQARGAAPSSPSDVFACGVVLYELATGRHPFVAESIPTLWRALESQDPTPPSHGGLRLPPALERLLLRMLEKQPQGRPTAREVEAALASIEAVPQDQWHGRESNSLPRHRTPFVGRAPEIAALESLLLDRTVRLVTLSGPGGSGKTRLAVEVAGRLADRFSGGVSFVNLAPTADSKEVASAVARAHGVADTGERPLVAALCDRLRNRGRMLVLLDNFEHVADAAPLIQEVLDACPALTVLVTSRVVLHLYGEHEFPVAPLPVPDSAAASPERLMESASVQLFVQRAMAVRPEFKLTAANGRAVAEICRRLDGLPLAIELAAARAKILPPTELLARLDRRLELLTGGPRDVPLRQQTLRSAIDWSYGLLAPAEQMLFRRMSVFVGGCGLDAVEAVCDAGEDLGLDVLSGVTALVDNSLLAQRVSDDGHTRCIMLETVREYARERLDESGETGATLRAHAAYALVLAEEGTSETVPADREAWVRSCDVEHDNLRAAIAYLVSTGNSEWGLRLGAALFKFWEWREHITEGRESLVALLALPGAAAPTRARARALYCAAVLADAQHDHPAAASLVREALDIYQRIGDANGVATTTNGLARQMVQLGGSYAQARSLFAQAVALWDQLGDVVTADQARANMASVAKAEGNHDLARTLLEQVVARSEKRGDIRSLAAALNALGDLAAAFGDPDGARRRHQDSLVRFRQIGDRAGTARVLSDLANLDVEAGDVDAATRLLVDALRAFQQAGHQRGVARQLETLTWCAAHRSRHGVAVRLASAAAIIRQKIRVPMGPVDHERIDRALSEARRILTPDEYARAWVEGEGMTPDQLAELVRA